jgi:hypothetical protein
MYVTFFHIWTGKQLKRLRLHDADQTFFYVINIFDP